MTYSNDSFFKTEIKINELPILKMEKLCKSGKAVNPSVPVDMQLAQFQIHLIICRRPSETKKHNILMIFVGF